MPRGWNRRRKRWMRRPKLRPSSPRRPSTTPSMCPRSTPMPRSRWPPSSRKLRMPLGPPSECLPSLTWTAMVTLTLRRSRQPSPPSLRRSPSPRPSPTSSRSTTPTATVSSTPVSSRRCSMMISSRGRGGRARLERPRSTRRISRTRKPSGSSRRSSSPKSSSSRLRRTRTQPRRWPTLPTTSSRRVRPASWPRRWRSRGPSRNTTGTRGWCSTSRTGTGARRGSSPPLMRTRTTRSASESSSSPSLPCWRRTSPMRTPRSLQRNSTRTGTESSASRSSKNASIVPRRA
mmetsp:Transcript_20427/g.40854  ORF Transcript_20427/g.40854 Transcript_20427/m.40854 type:complete len:289 (+) Transcript_20427:486-1352(+)